MIMHIYSVRDTKALAFGVPIFVPHEVVATRAFVEECRNPNSQLSRYPEDYELYKLGTFDDEYGDFAENRVLVLTASAVVAGFKEGK